MRPATRGRAAAGFAARRRLRNRGDPDCPVALALAAPPVDAQAAARLLDRASTRTTCPTPAR
ncbi:MAG: hypothetical protein MZV64_28100 [Ignavibacteriales bacterium]|nr:hypothetical protein [Ignavibacteriales bacterium]